MYHLDKAPPNLQNTATMLKNAFYVDNCIASMENVDELKIFIKEAKELLSLGKFDL